jgi:hypothetical protein
VAGGGAGGDDGEVGAAQAVLHGRCDPRRCC